MTTPDSNLFMDDIVVITGIGIVSALGSGRQLFWEQCRQARSGIKPIADFLPGPYRCAMGAWVDDFDPRKYLKPAVYRRMSRLSRMAASASLEALQDSGLDMDRAQTAPDRIGLAVGTAHGSSASIDAFYLSLLAEGPRGAQPSYFPETVPNAPAGHISIILGITGPCATFGQNTISAENALDFARSLLLDDKADAVIVCGCDEISATLFHCYDALGVMNKGEVGEDGRAQAQMGAGLALGEGAGALVLERGASATRRGASIYAAFKASEILGGPTAPGSYGQGAPILARAVAKAIEQADVKQSRPSQIVASANMSGDLERIEYAALTRTLKAQNKPTRVTPLRYLSGDFGGAGILGAAAIAQSIGSGNALPTMPLAAFKQPQDSPCWEFGPSGDTAPALMTGCSYGGGCAALVFDRYDRSAK